MANQRVLPQSKESLLQNYNKRLKDDIKSIMDNFTEIIKTAKVNMNTSSCSSSAASLPLCFTFGNLLLTAGCSFFIQIEDETQVSRPTQAEQDHYEMHVRAANIVSVTESASPASARHLTG